MISKNGKEYSTYRSMAYVDTKKTDVKKRNEKATRRAQCNRFFSFFFLSFFIIIFFFFKCQWRKKTYFHMCFSVEIEGGWAKAWSKSAAVGGSRSAEEEKEEE